MLEWPHFNYQQNGKVNLSIMYYIKKNPLIKRNKCKAN